MLLLREGRCKVTFATSLLTITSTRSSQAYSSSSYTTCIKDQAGHIFYLLATGDKIFINVFH